MDFLPTRLDVELRARGFEHAEVVFGKTQRRERRSLAQVAHDGFELDRARARFRDIDLTRERAVGVGVFERGHHK